MRCKECGQWVIEKPRTNYEAAVKFWGKDIADYLYQYMEIKAL